MVYAELNEAQGKAFENKIKKENEEKYHLIKQNNQ